MSFKFNPEMDFDMRQRDKKIHCLASMIAAVAMVVAYHLFGHGHPSFFTTVMVVMVPGLLRELYNGIKTNSSGFSVMDMLANYLGAALGWIFCTLGYRLITGTL